MKERVWTHVDSHRISEMCDMTGNGNRREDGYAESNSDGDQEGGASSDAETNFDTAADTSVSNLPNSYLGFLRAATSSGIRLNEPYILR